MPQKSAAAKHRRQLKRNKKAQKLNLHKQRQKTRAYKDSLYQAWLENMMQTLETDESTT